MKFDPFMNSSYYSHSKTPLNVSARGDFFHLNPNGQSNQRIQSTVGSESVDSIADWDESL